MRGTVGAALVILAALGATPAAAADKGWTTSSVLGVPVGADLRLRVLTVQSGGSAVDVNDAGSRLRKGFGGSMIDYYPFAADGFFVAAGGRMTTRMTAPPKDGPAARLLNAPRPSGYRSSRHLTPALTMGYSKQIDRGLTMGVEGGVLMGHFDSSYYSVVRPSARGRIGTVDDRGTANQVARMTVAYHF